MGFTTGFIGGVALTTSIFYVSLSLHERNRLYQSALLRQQSLLLSSIYDPRPPAPTPTSRVVIPGLSDRLKHRWNTELEAAVRKVQELRWQDLGRELEDRVAGVWGKGVGEVVDRAEGKN